MSKLYTVSLRGSKPNEPDKRFSIQTDSPAGGCRTLRSMMVRQGWVPRGNPTVTRNGSEDPEPDATARDLDTLSDILSGK